MFPGIILQLIIVTDITYKRTRRDYIIILCEHSNAYVITNSDLARKNQNKNVRCS